MLTAAGAAGVAGNKMLYNVYLIFGLLCNHFAEFSIKLYVFLFCFGPYVALGSAGITKIVYTPNTIFSTGISIFLFCFRPSVTSGSVSITKTVYTRNRVWYTGVFLSCSAYYSYSCFVYLAIKPTQQTEFVRSLNEIRRSIFYFEIPWPTDLAIYSIFSSVAQGTRLIII